METNNIGSGNTEALMQRFAVKSKKKKITVGNRAITFNRCSSKKQDFIYQAKITEEHVRRNNWILVKSFGVKESASKSDRKEFKEMLRFCREEKISHIVFFSYDRFSRNGDDSLLDKLRAKGIKVHAATQNVDDETASGRFSQSMYLKFAKLENDQRREKIVAGMRNKLRKGEWIGRPATGYEKEDIPKSDVNPLRKPQCLVNEKGRLIHHAFLWKDREKLTNSQIVKRLRLMGLTLTLDQLARIFRNPFYCGYITHSLLDEGEIIRGKHEAIIDVETFYRVNGLANLTPHGWKAGAYDSSLPLKATVKCGLCGLPLTGYVQKAIYHYYKCRNQGCCINVTAKKLHQQFADTLSRFIVSSELVPVIKNQLESTYRMLHQSEAVRVKPMKDESARLKNELEVMELNLATGKLPLELFLKHSGAHKQRIEAIEAQLEILGKDTSNLNSYLDSTLHFLGNLPEMWEKLDLDGKIRLQKLVFPEGLLYWPENDTLRTHSVNPIFSTIGSVSTILAQEKPVGNPEKSPTMPSLYLRFPSSNFFWENLEKIALEFRRIKASLVPVPLWVESKTGSTLSSSYVFESNSTLVSDPNLGPTGELLSGLIPYTGTTGNLNFRS